MEHMVLVKGSIEKSNWRMKFAPWSEEEVKNALKSIKNNKQPEPDGIKGEIYRWMAEEKVCLRTITDTFNQIVYTGEFPGSWKTSRTVMIPKKNKPKVEEHRPIALTNVYYKVLMSLLKEQIYEHMLNIGEVNELQVGFVKGRMEHNNICADILYKGKQEEETMNWYLQLLILRRHLTPLIGRL